MVVELVGGPSDGEVREIKDDERELWYEGFNNTDGKRTRYHYLIQDTYIGNRRVFKFDREMVVSGGA